MEDINYSESKNLEKFINTFIIKSLNNKNYDINDLEDTIIKCCDNDNKISKIDFIKKLLPLIIDLNNYNYCQYNTNNQMYISYSSLKSIHLSFINELIDIFYDNSANSNSNNCFFILAYLYYVINNLLKSKENHICIELYSKYIYNSLGPNKSVKNFNLLIYNIIYLYTKKLCHNIISNIYTFSTKDKNIKNNIKLYAKSNFNNENFNKKINILIEDFNNKYNKHYLNTLQISKEDIKDFILKSKIFNFEQLYLLFKVNN